MTVGQEVTQDERTGERHGVAGRRGNHDRSPSLHHRGPPIRIVAAMWNPGSLCMHYTLGLSRLTAQSADLDARYSRVR